jgi:DNA-binding LytR/AlgR family response regulator
VSTPVLLAEDEPEQLQRLARHLQACWPEIDLLPHAQNGVEAIALALQHLPRVIFLDIHMPACSGLDAAVAIVEDWPGDRELPQLVFVTAYDQYALQAFEHAAVDYLLKPVSSERLQKTVERLRQGLRLRQADAPAANGDGDTVGGEIRRLAAAMQPSAASKLSVITAAIGQMTHLIPVQDVIYFEAAEKYLRVVTKNRDALIRMTLRELLARVDPEQFWQIHRSVVVQLPHISHVERTEEGRLLVCLHQHPAKLAVSRLYAHRFKAM